ncbi:telomerase-binding protein EST1A-like [Lineus longissimus]|uniref:telomerase-binding protein EST1A-like n=1 Tax=Lineus longissimus TaxID=88925 RepID=UPI00315D953A
MEVVRITHQDLVDISKTDRPGQQKNNANQSAEGIAAREREKKRRERRERRPDMQIYQPAFRRQGKDRDIENEDLQSDGTEPDEVKPLTRELDKASLNDTSQSPAARRRRRRPDVQIYVPKPKIENDHLKSDQAVDSDPGVEEESLPITPPRRVDVVPNAGMLVTVMNDKTDTNGSDSQLTTQRNPPQSPSRKCTSPSKSKRYSQRGCRDRTYSGGSDAPSQQEDISDNPTIDWAEEVDQEFGSANANDAGVSGHVADEKTLSRDERRRRPERGGKGHRGDSQRVERETIAKSDVQVEDENSGFKMAQTLVFERSQGSRGHSGQGQSRGGPAQTRGHHGPAQSQRHSPSLSQAHHSPGRGQDHDRKDSFEGSHPKIQGGTVGRGRGESDVRDRGMGNRGRRRHGSGGGRRDNRQENAPPMQHAGSNRDFQGRDHKRGNANTSEDRRHVTFAEEGGRRSSDTGVEYQHPDRGRSRNEPEPRKTGHGGLIHLPTGLGASEPERPSSPKDVQIRSPYGRGRGRGRISTRALYDPHNPQGPKQSVMPGQYGHPNPGLQFRDPYEQSHFQPSGHQPDAYMNYHGRVPPSFDYQYMQGQQNYMPPGPYGTSEGPYFTHPGMPGRVYYDDRQLQDYSYNLDQGSSCGIQVKDGRGSKHSELILREIARLDQQLNSVIARRPSRESLQVMAALRSEMQRKSEELILTDPQYANEHNIEHHLWKTVYYHVVEMFRKQLSEEKEDRETKQQLLHILEEGVQFYEPLLKKLQSRFQFSLEDFLDTNKLLPKIIDSNVKLATLSCQRSMISLGDLARYKEQVNDTASYGKARSWYLKAHQLAPKNGRPYNQLAILAVYTRRKLDAVYYYIRSLSATNPFTTAREGLTSLFDEARRKAEAGEKKRLADRPQRPQKSKDAHLDSHRIEIWVSSDGSKCQDEVGHDDSDIDEDLIKMSPVELNKRFVLSFLQVHGKLFSKIGMEMYPDACGKMLHEFRALLQHSPSPVGSTRLLQLMVINMFQIENLALKGTRPDNEHRSLLQEHAIQLGLDIFSLLVERCVELFKEHLASPEYPKTMFSEDLHAIYPSVKVWCDWMSCHAPVWNPPPMRDEDYGLSGLSVWQNICDLCNILKDIDISHVKLYNDKKDSCDPVILHEDSMMAGFIPLLSMPQNPTFVHNTVDKDIAKDCLRIEKLQYFGDYLSGIEPQVLDYTVERQMYVTVLMDMVSESEEESSDTGTTQSEDSDEDDDDVIIERSFEEEAEGHVKELRAKKAELEKRVEENQKHKDSIQAILDNEKSNKPIVLEINPVNLVPDTNCFINHLDGIKRLVQCNKFTVIVPLVVISELDGLAKGSKVNSTESQEHADMVTRGAVASIDYLEEEFAKKNPNLKALTSKGTEMETISYRSETTDRQDSNDDLILSCCLHYAQDRPSEYMRRDKNSPLKLYRDVVLLTDDRNLCLKAFARIVPVKDLPSFLKWSKTG